jgi:hypothetical protein
MNSCILNSDQLTSSLEFSGLPEVSNTKLCQLRHATVSNKKRYESGRSPISNGFCFHVQSNPPTTLSRPPKNFCQPYFAP